MAGCRGLLGVSTFLLEIGTEELPADFARLALPQLEQLVRHDLGEARLSHGSIHCTGTPRRLVVQVHDLAQAAPDLEEERKGPPAAQAFKDGSPTQAAIGFARRCGIEADALEVRETPKGPFVFATVLERGRTATELLSSSIPAWIAALQGRRFMRWGDGECRFSRPVRWLVALLDDPGFEFTSKPQRIGHFTAFLNRTGYMKAKVGDWKELFWESAHHQVGD